MNLLRYSAYLRNAVSLLQGYQGEVPLAVYLKKFFSEHKKFGSTDRKQVTALLYRFFRIGFWAKEWGLQERILLAELLISGNQSPFFKEIPVSWEMTPQGNLLQKGLEKPIEFTPELHAGWYGLLQPAISHQAYVNAMLTQPDLFVRIRPNQQSNVLEKLRNANIAFHHELEGILRLSATSPISQVLKVNKEVVVQDVNSQRCGQVIKQFIPKLTGLVWDVCAASGGKSLLLHDIYNGIPELIVTDIRASILHNLKTRFQEAGIFSFRTAVLDLTKPVPKGFFKKMPQLILVDAPCTGSGTWSRTPENHHFFNPDTLKAFQQRQLQICGNALSQLKSGHFFVYITCSVFSMENEDVISQLCQSYPLQLLHQQVLDGTKSKADSMYIAIMKAI